MPRQTIAITGGTLNEAKALPEWVAKHAWVDEILIFDSGSTDGTVEIAKKLGCRVFQKDHGGNHNERLKFILQQLKTDWVWLGDPDEFITDGLKKEVREMLEQGTPHDGFTHPRINFFMGHPLYSKSLSSQAMKIVKVSAVEVTGRGYHDEIRVAGTTGHFSGEVHHFPNPSIHWMVAKQNYVSEFEIGLLFEKYGILTQRKFAWLLLTKPLKTLFKNFIKKKGYKDGIYGFVLSMIRWSQDVLVICKYWEKYIEKNPNILSKEDLPDPWRGRK